MGQIAKAQSSKFQSENGAEAQVRKSLSLRTKQQFDAAQDVPIWFEKICELEGATEAETLMAQSEMKKNEAQMMRMWSEEARGLVDIKAEENRLRDVTELEELQQRNEELEREGVVSWIGVEALASIINPAERRALAARTKNSRSQNEHEVIQRIDGQRRELIAGYYQRSRMRDAELSSSLREGHAMLRRFGELLQSTCNNMISNNQSKLLEELHKHGIEVGRLRATDAENKMHRKILLNPLDRHQSILLQHADATMLRLPSQEPLLWGYAHASDGPWRVRRYDKGMVREVMRAAAEQINAEHATALDALRNLAKVLDAIQEGSKIDVKLHKQVIETPRRARELIQARLETLGININVDGVDRLTKIRGELDIKSAARQVLAKASGRVDYYGRFYFEIHAHQISASGLPAYEPPVSANTGLAGDNQEDATIPAEFFSLSVEQPRARLSALWQEHDAKDSEGAAPATTEPETEMREADNIPRSQDGDDRNGADDERKDEEGKDEGNEEDEDDFFKFLKRGISAEDDDEEEEYEERDADQWMVGVSFDTLECQGFPGNDAASFGLRSDGTLWHAGRCHKFCADLSEDTVVGLLLDLNVGSLTPFAGGVSLGVAFGVGSRVFDAEEQAKQGAILRDKHLIPAFALKAKARRDLELSSTLSDTDSVDGPELTGPGIALAQTGGTSDELLDALAAQNDDDDDADDDNNGEGDAKATALDSVRESDDKSESDKTPDDDAGNVQNPGPTGAGGLDLGAKQASSSSSMYTPALSVNFGGYAFSRLPPHALSCDSYLSFAAESKQEIDRAQFEAKWRKERNESRRRGSYFSQPEEDTVSTGDSGAVEVVMEYKARMAFMESVQYETVASWSDFPPEAHRVRYCASTLQRAARRFLGRRWRQREMMAQTLAITLLQRKIKDVLPAWRRRKLSSATRIQKVWRGYRLRKQFRLAREFAQHPQLLESAATKVQATVRRRQAGNRARAVADAAEREIENLVNSAGRIQNRWRAHKAYCEGKRYRAIARSVNLVQRLWRGRAARAALDPAARDVLSRVGRNVYEIQGRVDAATSVQRVWRGKMDRSYAHMRRLAYHNSAAAIQFAWQSYKIKVKIDAICDWTLATNVKHFLRGIGAII